VTNFENEIAKFDLHSEDLLDVRREELLRLFPEVHTESGGVNFDALRLALGDSVEVGPESFGMSWPGKAECAKTIQRQSVATLLPVENESVNWETTQNVIIEGDNLEVLKTLQKAYLGKVKMIYIDPPYNTGNDFIYPDNYTESLKTYLQFTGQVDDEGRKFSTNTESSGRFHSKWMNMMYPRLSLARDLLRDDGVIFISIDDNEAHHLRCSMNEIFGSNNFVANLIWQSRTSISNDQPVSMNHNHTFVYAKNRDELIFNGYALNTEEYSNPDDDDRGPWKLVPLDANKPGGKTLFPITNPQTGEEFMPPSSRSWAINEETYLELLQDNRIKFGMNGKSAPKRKLFLNERIGKGDSRTPSSLMLNSGTTKDGTNEIVDLFGGTKYFSYPKPVKFISDLVQFGSEKDSLILDFFAGSGTTGEAVMAQNTRDSGSRRFILVQLPETSGLDPELISEGYKTIADVTKERIRKSGKKIWDESHDAFEKSLDVGFRLFSLDKSNFTVWEASAVNGDQQNLEQQLFTQVEHVLPGRTSQDILFELMLKSRYELTTQVKQAKVGNCEVWKVAGVEMVVIIDSGLTVEVIREVASWNPVSVVILDRSFGADDSLKSNARKIFEDAKIDLKTV
jgi:adenine-specific DNA-methyltransferase